MNKLIITLLVIAFIAACTAQHSGYIYGAPALQGDVLFIKSFNDGSLAGWSGSGLAQASIVNNGLNGKKALKLTSPNRGTYGISYPINNIGFFRGTTVRISATVRADNVSVPSQNYFGIKFMLVTVDYEGNKDYPQKNRVWGTFDWNSTIADRDVYIGPNIAQASISSN